MQKYNPSKIESKWQQYWDAHGTFVAKDDTSKPKKYILAEFPYPSGEGLHMGHLRPYVAGDVYSKFMRAQGFETVYPMGWDAFGLPAENYAIKKGVHPKVSTAKNIENAKRQVKSWGIGFDWSREVNTTDPKYYKWTQWIFLQLFKAGLAYEATGLINWCPKDKTGLANEEVINGKCDRCGTEVIKKELRQWYLKITAYAEKLLEGLKTLEQWPEAVKLQQANWIGKSIGSEIEFKVSDHSAGIKVFTTRPDTIFGATYLVLAPEHPLLEELSGQINNWQEVSSYIEQARPKQEMERTAEGKAKTGVELQGVTAINPATNQKIPIFVADYVLGNYGTGAIMAVPAHDGRDYEFALKYSLPIVEVVRPVFGEPQKNPVRRHTVTAIVQRPSDGKFLFIFQKQLGYLSPVIGGVDEGETVEQAAERGVLEETGYRVKALKRLGGEIESHFFAEHKREERERLDQPIVLELLNEQPEAINKEEADKQEVRWLSYEEIHQVPHNPARLPFERFVSGSNCYEGSGRLINSGKFDGLMTEEALPKMAEAFGQPKVQYKLRDWVFSRQRYWGEPIPLIHCAKCGTVAVPDEQLPVTLPEVEKYEPTGTGESPLAGIEEWVNVPCPKCGGPAKRETNTMPQWAGSSWYFLRYIDPHNSVEFAEPDKLKYWLPVDVYFGGMEHTTLHLLYSRFWHLFLYDQDLVPVAEPYTKRVPHGIILAPDGEKMSKSRGNVVNPDDIVREYGADTLRMYELFLGPHDMTVSWNDQGIIGVRRFLERVWTWVHQSLESVEDRQDSDKVKRELNKLIKKVTEDVEAFRFNTAISAFMQFHNEIKAEPVSKQAMISFLQLLYPFAPHVTEELHQTLGGSVSLQDVIWPKFDSELIKEGTMQLMVQINGKTKDKLIVPTNASEDEIKTTAMALEKVQALLNDAEPKRVIIVPKRLINIVI
jgi:leucyl-tRNA synthetase